MGATRPALKEISEEEVAKHNTDKDCWLIIHDMVLELKTDFLEEHPGGPDVITALAGTDCTRDFDDLAHSNTAREWANKYIKGIKTGASTENADRGRLPQSDEVSSGGGGG